MQGIIFDFNGTMFQDSPLHEAAWLKIIKKYGTGRLSKDDILHNLHGKTNDKIIRFFLSDTLTEEEISAIAAEKEAAYRKLCLAIPDGMQLTAGLETTLNQLKVAGYPMTIASASPKVNIDFYFDVFQLARWFDPALVIYDDGTFPGKPAPDIFLKAAAKLALAPSSCIVIEDSYSGLQAARKALIGKVIAIDPYNQHTTLFKAEQLADSVITDFRDFTALV